MTYRVDRSYLVDIGKGQTGNQFWLSVADLREVGRYNRDRKVWLVKPKNGYALHKLTKLEAMNARIMPVCPTYVMLTRKKKSRT